MFEDQANSNRSPRGLGSWEFELLTRERWQAPVPARPAASHRCATGPPRPLHTCRQCATLESRWFDVGHRLIVRIGIAAERVANDGDVPADRPDESAANHPNEVPPMVIVHG